MDTRRLLAEHPLPVVLTAAFLLALAVTLATAATGASTARLLRLAALSVVLFAFAAGFAAGPLARRYL